MGQNKSDWNPLAEAETAQAAAEMVRKAHAVGLVAEAPDFPELTYREVKAAALHVREAGVATWAAAAVERGADGGEPAALAERLNEISALLDESPLPDFEWPRLLEIFDRDDLARLLGTSPASVLRYAKGERRTPDDLAARLHFLALVVGDLAGAYNEIGVRRWFERKRTQLDGRAPAQLLKGGWQPEDAGPRAVRELARALVASPVT